MSARRALAHRHARLDAARTRAAFAVASLLLRYPDQGLVDGVEDLRAVVAALPASLREPLEEMCDHVAGTPLLALQGGYVETFDLKRRCCLYLSYYLNGDTRRRGMALWRFQEAYRGLGQRVVGGELPDYLPALLEFAAGEGEEPAVELMNEHRAGVLVLLEALEEMGSPYAGVVRAVDSLLPARGDRVVTEAERLVFEGPPSELVGLEDLDALAPYGASGPDAGCGAGAATGPQVSSVTIRERP